MPSDSQIDSFKRRGEYVRVLAWGWRGVLNYVLSVKAIDTTFWSSLIRI